MDGFRFSSPAGFAGIPRETRNPKSAIKPSADYPLFSFKAGLGCRSVPLGRGIAAKAARGARSNATKEITHGALSRRRTRRHGIADRTCTDRAPALRPQAVLRRARHAATARTRGA